MILRKLIDGFRRYHAELVGRPVLVALSGGADSVALLSLLDAARAELGCAVVAGHVHHHLRGAEADGDAVFCEELGRRLGVRVVVEDIDPMGRRGVAPEAHWRTLRYARLEKIRRETGCAAVATAHTLEDQAETVLIKLLRGAGPRGVAGVRRRRGTVIRPLLDCSRGSVRDWLRERGLEWREDSTNRGSDRPRSWVRYHLLPLLEERYPRVVEHLAGFAAVVAEDEVLLGGLLATSGHWPEVGSPVPLRGVAGLPVSLQTRWVLELAARLPCDEPPSRRQIFDVVEMIGGRRPAAVDLGGRWVLRRRAGMLHLSPPPLPAFAPEPASLPSSTLLAGGFVAHVGVTLPSSVDYRALLALRVSEAPLLWRPVRQGESWHDGRRLNRALADAGIVREWRRAWPVLEAGGTMVWVPAVGVAPEWIGRETKGIAAGLEVPWRHRERSSRET